MLGILADDHDTAFSLDDFALLANLFHGRFYFHVITPFLSLFFSPGDPTLGQIVDRNLDGYGVARENADIVHTEFTGDMCVHDISVWQFHLEGGVRQSLQHNAVFKFNQIIFRQKNPSNLSFPDVGQKNRSVVRYGDRMLVMSGQPSVERYDGPTVG